MQVYRQAWTRPTPDEARALGLRAGLRARVREVHLYCDEQPCVFARTIIPRATLQGKHRRLARLGNRSLGAVLFADKTLQRSAPWLAVIGKQHAIFAAATARTINKPKTLWGRRSLFYLSGKPLLLNELFLHDMSACTPKR